MTSLNWISCAAMLVVLAILAHAGDPIAIDADVLRVADGVAVGEGNVTVRIGPDTLTGATVTAWLDDRRASVTDGTWIRPESGDRVDFGTAEIDLTSSAVTVHDATWTGPDGLSVTGDQIGYDGDRLVADGVHLTFCDCDGIEPWSIDAKHVEIVPGELATFRGARVRVLGIPLLPIPRGSVPLDRRSGVLAPVLGFDQDGLRAALPLYWAPTRSFDATLTPELRTERSLRGLLETRYASRSGDGETTLAAGYDRIEQKARGGLDLRHGLGGPAWVAAVGGRLTSDSGYSADYGDRFLSRQQPWNEVRGLVGYGPSEIALDGIQSDERAWEQASVAVRQPITDLPLGMIGGASVVGSAWMNASGQNQGSAIRFTGHLERTAWIGPLRISPQIFSDFAADTGSVGPERERPLGVGGQLDVALPAWRATPGLFEEISPIVQVRGRLFDDQLAYEPLLTAAPGLSWVRSGRVRFSAIGTAWDHARIAVRLDSPHLYLWAEGTSPDWRRLDETPLAQGSTGVAVNAGAVRLDLGFVHGIAEAVRQADPEAPADLDQARGGLTVPIPGVPTVRLSGGLTYDLTADAFQSRSAGVRWTHPTGCAAVGATARFEVDRAWPVVLFDVDVIPN